MLGGFLFKVNSFMNEEYPQFYPQLYCSKGLFTNDVSKKGGLLHALLIDQQRSESTEPSSPLCQQKSAFG